jgi:redox-sensitive bicupin YhaK (pirin superfamily)
MLAQDTLDIRRAAERGSLTTGWLQARFSFSFGAWQHPERNGFGPLIALNEDRVEPGTGFAMHPHRDLEIFLLPLSGVVEHRDDLGHHALVRPGEVQKMSAGSGIRHSQMNPSAAERDHHLQIWLRPRTRGAVPAVTSRRFDWQAVHDRWAVLVSPDGRDGSLTVDQEAKLASAVLRPHDSLSYVPGPGRAIYLHAVSGAFDLELGNARLALAAGDAIALRPESAGPLRLNAGRESATALLFELGGVN